MSNNELNELKKKKDIKIEDFEILRHVGYGNFSDVYHVKLAKHNEKMVPFHQKTDNISGFALKIVEKDKIRKLKKEEELLMEKHCLSKLNRNSSVYSANNHSNENNQLQYESDNDFSYYPEYNIINLYKTFQDKKKLYLVMEYCQNGELWDMISGIGLLNKKLIQFYLVQLVNAIDYCHKNGIIHRDIKAENILITQNGYLKLIDFGSAVDIKCPEIPVAGNSTNSLTNRVFKNYVGTPEFMAPETLKNLDTGRLSDLWSLGCTIYQIICGIAPFKAPTIFLTHLLSRNAELNFPIHFPKLGEDLVRSLVRLNPNERLGSDDFNNLRNHPFLKNANFNDPNSILEGKDPFPPLYHRCFSYMSCNWDRWKPKLIENHWLLEDGSIPSFEYYESLNIPKQVIPEKFLVPYSRGNIEILSRELLCFHPLEYPFLRKALERVCSLKHMSETYTDEFWEKYVNDFLNYPQQ